MAFTSAGFRLTVTLSDKYNNTTNKFYDLTSADYATAVTDSAAIISAEAGVSDGEQLEYTIGEVYKEGTVTLPTVSTLVSTVASVTTALTTAGKKANYAIPMPKDAIMSGNDLITTNAAVQTYQALFTAGGKATISDGETASGASPIAGVRVSRKRAF